MTPRPVHIGNLTLGNDRPMALIAGPCALESRAHAMEMSHALVEITGKLGLGLIYKTSFDKANRTSIDAARGLGLKDSLPILAEIRERWGCAVLTDVHAPEQCAPVAEAVDVLQIPAFLCRQTDLLVAAAKTGRAVNVKKGQFLAPWDMKNVAKKLSAAGNDNILLCGRCPSWPRQDIPSSSTRRTRCSSRAGRGPRPAASDASFRRWRAPRVPSASPPCLWRRTKTPTTRPRMDPTWYPCKTCPGCFRRLSRSTAWRRRSHNERHCRHHRP